MWGRNTSKYKNKMELLSGPAVDIRPWQLPHCESSAGRLDTWQWLLTVCVGPYGDPHWLLEVSLAARTGVLFAGCPPEPPGCVTAVELVVWLLGATRAKASSKRECIVCRASSMEGWGGVYWEGCGGRPGYFPSSVDEGVWGSAGRSGSDWKGNRKTVMREERPLPQQHYSKHSTT